MTADARSLVEPVRERIALVRLLCIGCMIYVHVPGNAVAEAVRGVSVPFASAALQSLVIEGPGRASAALLSLVSGVLTAVALSRGTPTALYRRRFRSIVLPMLLWSGTTIALFTLASLLLRQDLLGFVGATRVQTLTSYADSILFLTDAPYGPTTHLGFLRDLFVCMLLSPLLLLALRHLGAAVLVALGALYLFDVESVVVLRPLIVFAFAIGLWLVDRGARLDALDGRWPLWLALFLVATAAVIASGTERALASAPSLWFAERGLDLREAVFYPLTRLFGGLTIWTLAAKLVGTRWHVRLAALTPYVFVAFCSHYLVLSLLWSGALEPLLGDSTNPLFLPWFVIAPFVAIAAAALLVESSARLHPPLAMLLTGGRVSAPVAIVAVGGRDPKARDPSSAV